MQTLRSNSRSEAGGALILSVIAVLVVSILAAGFLQLSLSITRRLSMSSDTIHALNLAEAGLAEAYTGLAEAHTGNVGSAEAPAVFGGGLMWVEATWHSDNLVELECTAMYGTGRATLGMVCEATTNSTTNLGFFTRDDLRLNPGVRLDSYDSSKGSYVSQLGTPLNNHGIVGSNGDVALSSGDMIFGDVVYGPNGKLNVAGGAILTGGSSARPNLEELPPVDVPSIPLGKAITHSGGTPMIVPPGDVGYQGLTVGKNSKLVLKGPMKIVVDKLSLLSEAELLFDTTDGPIEMYVTDSVDLNTGSLVSTSTQVTGDTMIMVAAPEGKTVNFGSKATFYGFIYAPDAEVHIASTYEIFGGVVVKELNLAAQGKLHLDLGLGATVEAQLPEMMSWRVTDLPQQAASLRMDPFIALGIDRDGLLPLADAHQDQLLEVRYKTANGSTDSYFGPESDFDWSLVAELLYGVRDGVAFFLSDDYQYDDTLGNDPTLDLVNSSLSSKELRDALLAAAPVSNEALVAACQRNPPMAKSDLDAVLDAHRPLATDVLLAAIGSASLDSSKLKGVLIDNSPLSPQVLAAVLARNPPLSAKDLKNVLQAQ